MKLIRELNENEIIDSREKCNGGGKYNNSRLHRMIRRRLKIISEHVGVKVFIENELFFYADDETECGEKPFHTYNKDIIDVMNQILFLVHTVECM
jgi:hypothetical protein